MSEKHYAFIKNNIVEQVAVFAEENEELADSIAQEQGYDDAVWLGETNVRMYSSYNPTTKIFTEPTEDYLYERGILPETTAMRLARIALMESPE